MGGQRLQRDVGQGRLFLGRQLGHRHHQGAAPTGRTGEDLDDRDGCALPRPHAEAREDGGALGVTPVDDEQGAGDAGARRDVDDDGVGREGVVEAHQRVAPRLDRAEDLVGRGHRAGRPEGDPRGVGAAAGDGRPVVHEHRAGDRGEGAGDLGQEGETLLRVGWRRERA